MRNAVKDLLAYGTLSYDDDTAFILIPTDDVTLDNEDPEIVDGGLDFLIIICGLMMWMLL